MLWIGFHCIDGLMEWYGLIDDGSMMGGTNGWATFLCYHSIEDCSGCCHRTMWHVNLTPIQCSIRFLGTRCSRSMGFMAYGVGHPSYFFWEWHLLKGFIQHQTLQVVHPNSERLEHEDHLQIQNLEELREVHGFYINIIHFQISFTVFFLTATAWVRWFTNLWTCSQEPLPSAVSVGTVLVPELTVIRMLLWTQRFVHGAHSFFYLVNWNCKMLVFCCKDMHINLPSLAGRNQSSWPWWGATD